MITEIKRARASKPLSGDGPLRAFEIRERGFTRLRQIANRFGFDRRHVRRRQLVGAQQARAFDAVTPIGLHAITGFLGN